MVSLEIVDVNGSRYATSQQEIKHRIFIRDKKFFNALVSPDAFHIGEAYVKGYFDISGNIKELYELVCDKLLSKNQRRTIFSFFSGFLCDPVEKEKENIEYHYNIPSRFYRLILGKTMGYTCGYYENNEATLDNAQKEKMDIICRKLRLKRGEYVLDIGCGWGNFAIHAAKYYGVRVTGITLSSEQKKYAEQWIEREGLSKNIQINLQNYRDLGGRKFDKISCVGMSEHVGNNNMLNFYQIVHNSLKTGGLFMQHTITSNKKCNKSYKNLFLDKYMFPGGELMHEHELLNLADSSGFELLNAENFRPHYIHTLNDWITRMEKNKDVLLDIVSKKIYRIFHIFFIGALISFQQKEISLFQNLFYKTGADPCNLKMFNSSYTGHEKFIA